ncbi:MAG: glycosyltransferase family A protein [Armatimonadetes bacterium]|nr:glycosyltransferase family A protein [Armatimonadota bacterium]
MNECRITFGMIVLNGEPFTRYNLRALYSFAHQIIVVEGACSAAKNIATKDGHSRDTTRETLRRFKAEEDPDNKLVIVTAEDEGHQDGFWPGEKHEMSQAYAKRATGNYLWQVDSDEFYRPEDMRAIIDMLSSNPEIKEVSFRVVTFFGGLKYIVDSYYLQRGAQDFHRLFAWGENFRYATHRPPTVVDAQGRNLREINAISAEQMAKKGMFMYHYEQLFPKQVTDKCSYYAKVEWSESFRKLENWAQNSYLALNRPYRVHMVCEHVSWLERFKCNHNPVVEQMVEDVRKGEFPGIELRPTDDIERLLSSPLYALTTTVLRLMIPANRALPKVRARIANVVKRTPLRPLIDAIRKGSNQKST